MNTPRDILSQYHELPPCNCNAFTLVTHLEQIATMALIFAMMGHNPGSSERSLWDSFEDEAISRLESGHEETAAWIANQIERVYRDPLGGNGDWPDDIIAAINRRVIGCIVVHLASMRRANDPAYQVYRIVLASTCLTEAADRIAEAARLESAGQLLSRVVPDGDNHD